MSINNNNTKLVGSLLKFIRYVLLCSDVRSFNKNKIKNYTQCYKI